MRDIIDDRFVRPAADAGPATTTAHPLARHGMIETDLFCDCGYNLHGQRVERDARLDLMLCRCPECGRWHPAGQAVAGRSKWLGRLAVSILAVWVLAVAGVLLAGTLVLLGFQFGHANVGIEYKYKLPDGRRIEYDPAAGNGAGNWVDEKTRQPVTSAGGFISVPVPRATLTDGERAGVAVLCGFAALVAAGMGGTIAVTAWHVRRWHHLWVAVLPLAAAGVTYASLLAQVRASPEMRVMVLWLAWFVALQVAAVAVGIALGRPIARGIVRFVVPPGPRQALAFLWRADGKPMPGEPTQSLPASDGGAA
ncbi:MAG TPA: hypothetical protein VK324_12290 [Tepidisphaeraceae bacterium]|nr:hypothetical protein [Tepidisphaeraceae bacterium]